MSENTRETVSLHDCMGDAAVSGRGLPDDYAAEQDRDLPDAAHPQYTPAEEQEMYDAYVAGCIERGIVSAPTVCLSCGVETSLPPGRSLGWCRKCERAAEERHAEWLRCAAGLSA